MYRQSEKNLLSSNISSTCPHNMVNFGPLVIYNLFIIKNRPVYMPATQRIGHL